MKSISSSKPSSNSMFPAGWLPGVQFAKLARRFPTRSSSDFLTSSVGSSIAARKCKLTKGFGPSRSMAQPCWYRTQKIFGSVSVSPNPKIITTALLSPESRSSTTSSTIKLMTPSSMPTVKGNKPLGGSIMKQLNYPARVSSFWTVQWFSQNWKIRFHFKRIFWVCLMDVAVHLPLSRASSCCSWLHRP